MRKTSKPIDQLLRETEELMEQSRKQRDLQALSQEADLPQAEENYQRATLKDAWNELNSFEKAAIYIPAIVVTGGIIYALCQYF